MLKTTEEPLTADDYRDLPGGTTAFPAVEGKLHMTPSPEYYHQSVAGNIYHFLRCHPRDQPLGKVAIAPSDVQLDFVNVHQPDVYFIANERLNILTKQGPVGAPDLVMEVLSKSTARLDKEKKEVAVYRFAADVSNPVRAVRRRQKLTTPLLPGLKLALAEVFEE